MTYLPLPQIPAGKGTLIVMTDLLHLLPIL